MSDAGKRDLTNPSTDADAGLGDKWTDANGNVFRYMQADGAVTSYQLYDYDPATNQVQALIDAGVNPTDTNGAPACVWDGSATAVADNEYAWFKIAGALTLQNDASGAIAANEIIYASATAGRVTNVATAGLLRELHAYGAVAADATGTFYIEKPLHCEDLP